MLISCNNVPINYNEIRTILHAQNFKPIFYILNIYVLFTAVPNPFKEINLLILRAIVKTGNFVCHTGLCILWRFGCFNKFCGVKFQEGGIAGFSIWVASSDGVVEFVFDNN